jgi:hypothetical protein
MAASDNVDGNMRSFCLIELFYGEFQVVNCGNCRMKEVSCEEYKINFFSKNFVKGKDK